MATIKLKNGSGAPLASDLVQGEPALDLTNKRLYTEDTLGAVIEVGVNPTELNVTGDIAVGGTVDGRDIATDGTKLDGIEAGATADQTDAEIRAAVEAATDSNVFTDADHTKLDGIEAGADVTDTANVTAAGALMDSELTSEASVKALDQGVATTDSPTFAGLTTTADVSFGDNDKAVFGAGSDLQIYHTGGNSFIGDFGTGDLYIRGSNELRFQVGDGGGGWQNAIYALDNNQVQLLYAGNTRLTTTSTGIDVTGEVRSDSLKVDGGTNTEGLTAEVSGVVTDLTIGGISSGADLRFSYNRGNGSTTISEGTRGSETNLQQWAGNGDISFYNSAGTSQDFFWDASTSRLGLGTTNPIEDLEIEGTDKTLLLTDTGSNSTLIRLKTNNFTPEILVQRQGANSSYAKLVAYGNESRVELNNNQDKISKIISSSAGDLEFETDSSQKMIILDTGNVGIGTDSPSETLDVAGTFTSKGLTAYKEAAKFKNNGDASSWARADWVNDQASGTGIVYRNEGGEFVFRNDNSSGTAMNTTIMAGGSTAGVTRFLRDSTNESMRIDSSGNVGIGTILTDAKLTVVDNPATTGAPQLTIKPNQSAVDGVLAFPLAGASKGSIISNKPLTFHTNALTNTVNERMRIDSSGNLLVGDSASPQTTRLLSKGVGNGSSNYSAYFVNSDETELFGLRNDGVVYTGQDGGSPYNLTTATSANLVVESTGVLRRSTSSRRYKTDIQTATWTGEQIDALRPVTYKGINDGDTVFAGLIAEEVHDAGLTEFVLYNESNEPDAIHYQQMVALCIKEIQSLRARVAQLEGAN